MSKVKNKKGMTLVELLVAMAVFLIILGLMYPTFDMIKEQSVFIEDMEALNERAQRIIDYMAEDIRMAGFVVGPKDNIPYCKGDGLKTVVEHTDGTPYDALTFITAEPVEIKNYTDCMQGDSDYRVYVAANASIGDSTLTLTYDISKQTSGGTKCVSFLKETSNADVNAQSLIAFETASYVNNLYTIKQITNKQITLHENLSIAVSQGSPLFVVKRYSYTVNPNERSLRRRYWVSSTSGCQPEDIVIDEESGALGGIDALQFEYLYYDPITESIVTDDEPPSDLTKLRSIRIWLLVRSESADRTYTNTNTYSIVNTTVNNGQPFNDHFRRVLINKIVEVNSLAK